MTKEEKTLLEKAARVIRRELALGNEVRIRNFGHFRLSRISANKGGPNGGGVEVRVNVVRFRPWEKLKKAIRQEKVVEGQKLSLAPNRRADEERPARRPMSKINW